MSVIEDRFESELPVLRIKPSKGWVSLKLGELWQYRELLYFWGIGDLHYRAIPSWREQHTQRLSMMYQYLHELSHGYQ